MGHPWRRKKRPNDRQYLLERCLLLEHALFLARQDAAYWKDRAINPNVILWERVNRQVEEWKVGLPSRRLLDEYWRKTSG